MVSLGHLNVSWTSLSIGYKNWSFQAISLFSLGLNTPAASWVVSMIIRTWPQSGKIFKVTWTGASFIAQVKNKAPQRLNLFTEYFSAPGLNLGPLGISRTAYVTVCPPQCGELILGFHRVYVGHCRDVYPEPGKQSISRRYYLSGSWEPFPTLTGWARLKRAQFFNWGPKGFHATEKPNQTLRLKCSAP